MRYYIIMSRIIFIFLIMTAILTGANARTPQVVKLDAPDLSRGMSLMEALKERKSVREFAATPLSLKDLSDLLWAADGVNRPDGHHTAATALNKEDIDIYVLLEEGAYLYRPASSELQLVAEGDHRELIRGRQEDFPIPPAALVMVSTPSRFGIPDANASMMMGAVDAGIVSQNIMLFCAANGLVTVPRASMDSAAIATLLKLPEGALPIINNPVGYPAK